MCFLKFTLLNIPQHHFVVNQKGLFFSVCIVRSENRDAVDSCPTSPSGVLHSPVPSLRPYNTIRPYYLEAYHHLFHPSHSDFMTYIFTGVGGNPVSLIGEIGGLITFLPNVNSARRLSCFSSRSPIW